MGGNVWQSTRFRLISATNRNLEDLVERGLFRLDLYHRIAGDVFRVPALAERKEDILPLARHFLSLALDNALVQFEPTMEQFLLNRPYKGNARELEKLIERIAYRHVGDDSVVAGDVPETDRPADGTIPTAWPDERFERMIAEAIVLGNGLREITQTTTETAIRIAVQYEHGNIQRAARRLGVIDRALQLRRAAERAPAHPL